jgi:hypothetical protein
MRNQTRTFDARIFDGAAGWIEYGADQRYGFSGQDRRQT